MHPHSSPVGSARAVSDGRTSVVRCRVLLSCCRPAQRSHLQLMPARGAMRETDKLAMSTHSEARRGCAANVELIVES